MSKYSYASTDQRTFRRSSTAEYVQDRFGGTSYADERKMSPMSAQSVESSPEVSKLQTNAVSVAKVHRAVVTIQKLIRGRMARDQFLVMYQNRNVVQNMLAYFVFYIITVMYIVFKKTSTEGWVMQHQLRDLILEEEFLDSQTQIKKTFFDVATEEEFWQYLEGPFANNIFPSDCYVSASAADPCRGSVYGVNLMIGGVKLSTYRVSPSPPSQCSVPGKSGHIGKRVRDQGCYLTWSEAEPSRVEYLFSNGRNDTGAAAAAVNAGVEECFDPKTMFREDAKFWSTALSSQPSFKTDYVMPKHSFTPADSMTCVIPYSQGALFPQKIKALREAQWVDRSTRAVLVEMTFMNPPLGMVTSVRLVFEFMTGGGVIVQYLFSTSFMVTAYDSATFLINYGLWAALVIYVLGYLWNELQEMRDDCRIYWGDFWNIVDLLNYFIMIFIFGLDIVAQNMESSAVEFMNKENSDVYIDWVGINYINDVGNWCLSINMMLLTIKLFVSRLFLFCMQQQGSMERF